MSELDASILLGKSETTIRYWMSKFDMTSVDLKKLAEIKQLLKAGHTLPQIKSKLHEKPLHK